MNNYKHSSVSGNRMVCILFFVTISFAQDKTFLVPVRTIYFGKIVPAYQPVNARLSSKLLYQGKESIIAEDGGAMIFLVDPLDFKEISEDKNLVFSFCYFSEKSYNGKMKIEIHFLDVGYFFAQIDLSYNPEEKWKTINVPIDRFSWQKKKTKNYIINAVRFSQLNQPKSTFYLNDIAFKTPKFITLDWNGFLDYYETGILKLFGETSKEGEIEINFECTCKDASDFVDSSHEAGIFRDCDHKIRKIKLRAKKGKFAASLKNPPLRYERDNIIYARIIGTRGEKPGDSSSMMTSNSIRVFGIRTHKKMLPKVIVKNGELYADDKKLNLWGVHFTPYLSDCVIRFGYEKALKSMIYAFGCIKRNGYNLVRFGCPHFFCLLQPYKGIFPDSPDYQDILKKAMPKVSNLNRPASPYTIKLIDEVIDYAGKLGIYIFLGWLGSQPCKDIIPYDEIFENVPHGWRSIDYLSTGKYSPKIGKLYRKAIAQTLGYLSKRYKGNTNILGIEIPYNEPTARWHWDNGKYVDVFLQFIKDCAKSIKKNDPQRLVFVCNTELGSGNLIPGDSWGVPEEVDGFIPHHYFFNTASLHDANITRKIHSNLTLDWLAPLVSLNKPILIGEYGTPWGPYHSEDKLPRTSGGYPDLEHPEACRRVIDAAVMRYYLMGVNGPCWCGWTAGGKPRWDRFDVDSYHDPVRRSFEKFIPVFLEEGSLDKNAAELAIIEDTDEYIGKIGHVPNLFNLTDVLLDLGIFPFHFIARQQIKNINLEKYKVFIVIEYQKHFAKKYSFLDKEKVIFIEKEAKKTIDRNYLKNEIEKRGIKTKDMSEVLIASKTGKYILIYKRKGKDKFCQLYLPLKKSRKVKIIDVETGCTVYKGGQKKIIKKGLKLYLKKWQVRVLKVTYY